jgi:hypothetical protein
MKRNLIGTLSLVVMSLLLNINGAYAQSVAQANVPFAFNLGSSQLPAGNYKIERAGFDPNFIMIRNLKTGTTTLSLFQPESPSHVSGKLVFLHLGNRYILTQIWGTKGSAGLKFRVPKPATKLEIASEPSPSGKEVEIALK